MSNTFLKHRIIVHGNSPDEVDSMKESIEDLLVGYRLSMSTIRKNKNPSIPLEWFAIIFVYEGGGAWQ